MQPDRVLKSVSTETTFEKDLDEAEAMMQVLEPIAQTVRSQLSSKQTSGGALTLKVKFANYEQLTCIRTEPVPISETKTILGLVQALLSIAELSDRKVRLLGISISNLGGSSANRLFQQLALPLTSVKVDV